MRTDDIFYIGGDMPVPRMGFGAMRICGPGIWGHPADVPRAHAVLRRTVELGVRLIDTADAYGPEVSEYLIAEALHPYVDDVVVATKGGLVRGGPSDWQRDARPAHLERRVNNSLRRLKVECIDLYQLHAPDPDVPLEESLGALARMQKAGKIRHVGVSNFGVDELERGRKVVDIVTVQNRYNLTDRGHEAVVDYCAAHGIGFIPWFPLATGALADDARLKHIASAHDASASQIALAWLLHRSPVMLPIPGTSSIARLEENCAASDIALSAAEMKTLGALA